VPKLVGNIKIINKISTIDKEERTIYNILLFLEVLINELFL